MASILPSGAASAIARFLRNEAAGGTLLMAAAAVVMILANSPAASLYFDLLGARVGRLSVLYWTDDGRISLFLLFVGWN